uniref:FBA_2 domain-containing protein n=2 Tax=Caenorhabditis tropicalis TaxID=1561998 RepID=A0A1I7TTY7_9PELO
MDVFNRRFGVIYFKLEPPLTNDQLIEIINWLNNTKTEIREVIILEATLPMFEIFISSFRKNLDFFDVFANVSNGIGHQEPNFQIRRFFFSEYSTWFNHEYLMSLDCEHIQANKMDFSSENMNQFFRSWQEGKTNRRLERCELQLNSYSDVKNALKGCGGELMDPRTTRLKFRSSNGGHNIWIYGGIHFRGNDGRLAVVELTGTYFSRENDENCQTQIKLYLEEMEKWDYSDDRLSFHKNLNVFFF